MGFALQGAFSLSLYFKAILQEFLHIDNTNDRFNRITTEELGFPVGRHNSDNSQTDSYGRRLLEVCRSFNLYIANGRLGTDKFLGSKTCNASTCS